MDITGQVIREEERIGEENTGQIMVITKMEVTINTGSQDITDLIMGNMEGRRTGDMTSLQEWKRSGTKIKPGETNPIMLLMEQTMAHTTQATRKTGMDQVDMDLMDTPITEMIITTNTGLMAQMVLIGVNMVVMVMMESIGLMETIGVNMDGTKDDDGKGNKTTDPRTRGSKSFPGSHPDLESVVIEKSFDAHLILPTAVKFVVILFFLFVVGSYFQAIQ